MLSKKEEQRSFSNGRLRDKWEKRAQSEADQCKQESEWKEKSSLKLLFSKWTYHLSVTNGDQTKGEMSDFRKLSGREDEANTNKPKIKFKIVPPPPKSKPEPRPPPPLPRRRSSPKPHRPKRKVEVDVFGLCWKESWKSLKPPKYLYLRDKEKKPRVPGFTTIEVTNNRLYKQDVSTSEEEVTPPAEEWSHSWKQVKRPEQSERPELTRFQWEILFERKLDSKAKVEEFSLPVWAGTWKIMNFVFRQQKPSWDRVWPDYPQPPSDKSEELEQFDEQDTPSDWEESWKLSGAELEAEDDEDDENNEDYEDEEDEEDEEYEEEEEDEEDEEYEEEEEDEEDEEYEEEEEDEEDDETSTGTSRRDDSSVMMKINDVFLPGWSNSWLFSAAPLGDDEEREKNWSSCWGYRQQIRWCTASLESHQRHSDMMTRRRINTNVLLASQLDEDIADREEWTEAWRTLKGWVEPEEEEERGEEEEVNNVEDVKEDEEKDEGVDEEEEERGEEEEVNNVEDVKEDEEKDEGVDEEEDEEEDEEGSPCVSCRGQPLPPAAESPAVY
nr:PREDICTED: glutamic acid-rich protein-like [Paralichthys olivaceus]